MLTDEEREASRILDMVREGADVPQSVIRWALYASGDVTERQNAPKSRFVLVQESRPRFATNMGAT